MDKGAVKRFATSARKKLLNAVKQKAFELGVEQDMVKEAEVYQDGFLINGQFHQKYEIKQREELVKQIEQKGFEHVIDEVAYTWFNRLIAIRYMEVNDYLPTGVRVFSSIEPSKREPDILTEVLMLVDDLKLNQDKIYEYQDTNNDEELFKYILIKQCNALGEIMPMIFEEIADYTELLLPNQLLSEMSVIHDMVTMIDEDDWTKEVEIIGWLYQYYISEKKDEVFADLGKNIKISKENIPAATELFTPRWIVQYMVDNSLGRLWLESTEDQSFKEELSYYLESADQPEDVYTYLEKIKNTDLNPEMITFLDPAMGSGHILVYAFEIFHAIYKSRGYREQDIPKFILENNLYGLDIDPRAAQLANFAIMMKARSYNRRLFNEAIQTNLHWIEESNGLTEEDIELFVGDTDLKGDITTLLATFKDGKLIGSIIEVPEINITALEKQVYALHANDNDNMFELDFKAHSLPIIVHLITQAKIMSRKYDVAVTNPPYMGRKGMNAELTKYVRKQYKEASADLYAVFMQVMSRSVKEHGFIGLINQHSWMFLSSFEALRKSMLQTNQIYSMAHLGTRAFAEIGGEVVQSTTFVMRKNIIPDYVAKFVRLVDYNNADEKAKQFYDEAVHYQRTQDGFSDIPGSPIAYWASEKVRRAFESEAKIGNEADIVKGLDTCDNDRFVRLWHEVSFGKIGFDVVNSEGTFGYKWFPYSKGGSYRKWYGNNEYVVNWENDGEVLRNLRNDDGKIKSRPQNTAYYFKQGITWASVSSKLSMRMMDNSIFGGGGSALFFNNDLKLFMISFLNSKAIITLINLLNPTLNVLVGDLKKIPIMYEHLQDVNFIAGKCIKISKSDWDSFETSWDFKTHPFLEFKEETIKLSEAYDNWEQEAESRFETLKTNEEELNRIFLDLYGLEDELTPDVEDKEVTVNRADPERDVKSFLSYLVGVMFGRYSHDEKGLIFAGGEFDLDNYKQYKPDVENIIPITDDVYFEDDIVTRVIDLVRVTFGEDHLEENLEFIAETLEKRKAETARQRIRRYFLKEFYKDHVRMYQKRPIYWLFDSGKQDGFKALVYLHRYKPYLVSRVRTEYLHELQKKYTEEMTRQDFTIEADVSTREKTKARKKKEKIQKQLLECQKYDQVIAHMAHQQINLDLDDGVKVNYDLFQNIEVPQGEGKKPLKANILAKI